MFVNHFWHLMNSFFQMIFVTDLLYIYIYFETNIEFVFDFRAAFSHISACFFSIFARFSFLFASYCSFQTRKNRGVYKHRFKLLFVPLAWKHIHLMLWHTMRPAMKKLPKKIPFTLSSLKINAVSLNHKIYAASYECWTFTIVGSYLSVSFCQPACPSVTRLCLNVVHTIKTGWNCYVQIATAVNVQDVRDHWIIKSVLLLVWQSMERRVHNHFRR